MSILTITGFAGSFSAPSRTRALVEQAVDLAADRFNAVGQVFDLSELGPSLGAARQLGDLSPEALELVTSLVRSDALVIASPVHKGSYSGMFKHVFDLLDPGMLHGKPVLLAATGGGDRHALVVEHQLRPLFGFFEAQPLATGVYVSDRDFVGGKLVDEAARARLSRAVGQFAPYLSDYPVPVRGESAAPILHAL
ncbi:NAD(P)H-dependent oxidoreductase [Paracoccus sp. CPCC 101403]|uniref:NAD(P)H-dependent oxidoreductase n=2 Tax=Paracoccus broussonetiae TaxID=3075834 RepID=A0ABU3EJN0_9RHOB|nr:NAD(P)H-dependent oxidoreductase [Paracoccus sp. CPCC 101403]MDT1063982.1 NAD(P)H-dependent oxidoreductase [Paracoccus sp. CPCC 101403]